MCLLRDNTVKTPCVGHPAQCVHTEQNVPIMQQGKRIPLLQVAIGLLNIQFDKRFEGKSETVSIRCPTRHLIEDCEYIHFLNYYAIRKNKKCGRIKDQICHSEKRISIIPTFLYMRSSRGRRWDSTCLINYSWIFNTPSDAWKAIAACSIQFYCFRPRHIYKFHWRPVLLLWSSAAVFPRSVDKLINRYVFRQTVIRSINWNITRNPFWTSFEPVCPSVNPWYFMQDGNWLTSKTKFTFHKNWYTDYFSININNSLKSGFFCTHGI